MQGLVSVASGEAAALQLLRVSNQASGQATNKIIDQGKRLPSFLSAGIPRDRRGRMARKSVLISQLSVENGGFTEAQRDDLFLERAREKQLLASLR
jgi:hypothetical protein